MSNGYVQAKPVELPDLNGGVYDFILKFALPAIDGKYIFNGRPDDSSLPPDADGYAVFTHLGEERKGSNGYYYDKTTAAEGSGIQYILKYSIAHFQIDFYSEGTAARDRAAAIETVARSPAGAAFFKDRHIGCLYAEDPKSVEYVNASDKYVYRWITTLRLGYWSKIGITTDCFNNVNIRRIENADVFYPPKK